MSIREMAATTTEALAKPSAKTSAIIIAAFVAIMAVCSWIRIPGPVPVTMQTFAVFLTISLLGTRRGTIAVCSYIAIGLAGVPVFANFAGGIPYLLGPTGGYIIGFIAMALVAGTIMDRFGKSIAVMALAMLAGLAVVYAFGTVWFMAVTGTAFAPEGIQYVLGLCVTPFIIPDAIKIALAIAIAKTLQRVKEIRSEG